MYGSGHRGEGRWAEQASSAGVCSKGAFKCALNPMAQLGFPPNHLHHPELPQANDKPGQKGPSVAPLVTLLNLSVQSQHCTEWCKSR